MRASPGLHFPAPGERRRLRGINSFILVTHGYLCYNLTYKDISEGLFMLRIQAYHNSRELRFREPFGALPCGAEAVLRLFVWGPAAERAEATLRTWNGDERFYKGSPRREQGNIVYEFRFRVPEKPCVLWYNFRVNAEGRQFYLGAEDGLLRSGGSVLTSDMPKDFRITVYDPAFAAPEGFKGRIAYQIFPDRFFRGEHPGLEKALAHHRTLGRRVTEKEWGDEVDYLPRAGEKYYSPQDYYLGNLSGIREKIPYLKSLGVEVLYLNPVFESAYNHRYSISDHMNIDPLLGTEEDFVLLARALHEAGIKLILDGVFSHTGDDSIYFDRRGNYGGGAYSSPRSPYREWYDFDKKYKHGYRCWWDFDTLPEVNELTPSYMEFIAGVLEKWVRLGADGWRLDVADELPDEFIKFLRGRLKAADPQAILIGEVWEDAALKEDGFGRRREYVNGAELDGVMDYPFMEAALDFLTGRIDSAALKAALGAQLEGYPRDFMRSQLGLIGSHDTQRALSVLSGAPPKDTLPRPRQAEWLPTAENAERGKKRLKLASALQFAMPFMPCVYYGDEAGLTGLTDPFCRRPYPWGREDNGLLEHYRLLAKTRGENEVFRTGAVSFAAPYAEVFAIARTGMGEAVTAVNRSANEVTVRLSPADFAEGEGAPALFGTFRDAASGALTQANGLLEIKLAPMGFCTLLLN